jgi:uncharacterized membrane protein (TIGR02234 family)
VASVPADDEVVELSDPGSATRSLKIPTLAVLTVGAAVALLAATQIWVEARLAIEGFPGIGVEPTGRILVPLVPAVGLLALGGALAMLLVGRVGRGLIGGLVAVLAVVGAAASVTVTADPASSVSATLAEAGGVTEIPGGTSAIVATATAWPLVAIGGLVVVVLAAATAALCPSSRWPRGGRRYAAADSAAGAAGRASATSPHGAASSDADGGGIGLWDALERGDDPTV